MVEITQKTVISFEMLRACNGSDFRNDPDTKLHLQVNHEKTKDL